MSVRVLFLGKLSDLSGGGERDFPAPLDWLALVDACDGDLGDAIAGESVRVAVNGALLADKIALAADDGDEVALLPPVSGG